MIKLHFSKAHNAAQLTGELFAAHPGWTFIDPTGRRATAVALESLGTDFWATVPEADQATVTTVVNAHVADAAWVADPQRRQAAQYLRNTIAPLLPGLIDGTATLTNAQRDRSIAALCILVKGLYQQDA